MARGIALSIGLNEVDPRHYRDEDGRPWEGTLAACENDARDMASLATKLGYDVRGPLLTKAATSAKVLAEANAAAKALGPGDTFLLTYSGHGGQVENRNPDADPEEDKLDETWCLYDRELLDDELFALFADFAPGVRVVVFSDSCHSGSVTRAVPRRTRGGDAEPAHKHLPLGVAIGTEKAHEKLYRGIQKAIPSKRLTTVGATVVLISGCQDNQFSKDGRENGVFTAALLEAWKEDPGARRSLRDLWRATSDRIDPRYDQTPNYLLYAFDVGPALVI
jgi:hypothetical protein